MNKEIDQQDLVLFSKLSRSLWVDLNDCEKGSSEALAVAGLMNLTPERTLDKAIQALLERANLEGMAGNSRKNQTSLLQCFFRLTPEERLSLAALHVARWSYQRLTRVLNTDEDSLQELVWAARLQLSLSQTYPTGPSTRGVNCLSYDMRKPWTQRFLDDELSSKGELIRLQRHLVECESCLKLLNRCRDLYFKVDRELMKIVEGPDFSQGLKRIWDQIPDQVPLAQQSFRGSLKALWRQPDIPWLLLFLVIFVFLKSLHRISF